VVLSRGRYGALAVITAPVVLLLWQALWNTIRWLHSPVRLPVLRSYELPRCSEFWREELPLRTTYTRVVSCLLTMLSRTATSQILLSRPNATPNPPSNMQHLALHRHQNPSSARRASRISACSQPHWPSTCRMILPRMTPSRPNGNTGDTVGAWRSATPRSAPTAHGRWRRPSIKPNTQPRQIILEG
jgi:hypothetical protein